MGRLIRLKVIPRSSRDEICGLEDETLKIRVKDAPVEGAANEKVVSILAAKLGVSKADIRIVRGLRSRVKIVEIGNLSLEDVRKLIEGG